MVVLRRHTGNLYGLYAAYIKGNLLKEGRGAERVEKGGGGGQGGRWREVRSHTTACAPQPSAFFSNASQDNQGEGAGQQPPRKGGGCGRPPEGLPTNRLWKGVAKTKQPAPQALLSLARENAEQR